MSIVCKECGFENEDGDKYCAMCNSDLSKLGVVEEIKPASSVSSKAYDDRETLTMAQTKTIAQSEETSSVSLAGRKRFFVNCENSRTKTFVDSTDITSYYCEGCKEEHQIDNFFWSVQEEIEDETENIDNQSENIIMEQINSDAGQHLVLEDVDTHLKIEISSVGGTFGRYGTYGASYLQNNPRGRMVSGEHCEFKYEYGRWSIEHLSKTNDTIYNGRKLEHGFEEALRDGKIITFANAISFIIRIY